MDEKGIDRTFPAQDRGDFKRGIETIAASIVRLVALPPPETIEVILEEARSHATPVLRERCGTTRILDMDRPIDSDAIYTRVNLLERLTGRRRKTVAELKAEFKIEEFGRLGMADAVENRVDAERLAHDCRRLLILGKPGAGKTTFLKWLALRCVARKFRPDLAPAYVELRSLGDGKIIDYIRGLWAVDPWPLIESGRSLLLLDALDEIPDSRFTTLRIEIDDIASRAGASAILITSRIAAREYVFPQFTDVEVADFSAGEIAVFAKHWFSARGMQEKTDGFLVRLRENLPMMELAHSPLLLTMMCLLFEGRADFDGNRAELYEEAIGVLLKKWDARRSILRDRPYELLTVGRRLDLLCIVARSRFESNEYLFDKHGLADQICEYFSRYGDISDMDAEAIVKAMEAQHGLLVERANNIYSFSHLTFQEFFTARSIVHGSGDRWAPLVNHIAEPRWREIFLLVCSMVEPEEVLARMQSAVDETLRAIPESKEIFEWLERKSTAAMRSIGNRHCAALVRALYFHIGMLYSSVDEHDHWYKQFTPIKNVSLLELGLDIAQSLDPDVPTSLHAEIDIDLCLALAYTGIDGAYYGGTMRKLSFPLAHATNLAHRVDSLLPMVHQLDDFWNGMEKGGLWGNEAKRQFREITIAHRDIGQKFQLGDAAADHLNLACQGYRLVADCMRMTRVTVATRTKIEQTLFCPDRFRQH